MLATMSEQTLEPGCRWLLLVAGLLVSGKGNVCHLQRGTSQECVDVCGCCCRRCLDYQLGAITGHCIDGWIVWQLRLYLLVTARGQLAGAEFSCERLFKDIAQILETRPSSK